MTNENATTIRIIKEVLESGDTFNLMFAFVFNDTVEGFGYWSDVAASDELSIDARENLEAMLKSLEEQENV